MQPSMLAESVMKLMGDVDYNTAQAALKIAMVLNEHREISKEKMDTISRPC